MLQFWVDFISKILRPDDSAQVAAGRLKGSVFVDRLSLSPATLDAIRNELVHTISRYLVIDENAMSFALQAEGRTVALAASIPVVRPRMEVVDSGRPAVMESARTAVVDRPSADSGEREARSLGMPYDRSRARALRRKRQARR